MFSRVLWGCLTIVWLGWRCSGAGSAAQIIVSRGVLRLAVPGDFHLNPADSAWISKDGKTRIQVFHKTRKDTLQPNFSLSAEDWVVHVQDSLLHEAGYYYISRPMNRFTGALRGLFFVAARDSQSLKRERLEVLILESPEWFHTLQVHLKGPPFRLSRDELDELYDSASEIQKRTTSPSGS